ncbi:MAG: serine O-acetyltransferase [Pseudomonadota bacterium]
MGWWKTIIDDVDSVFDRDPAARSRWEIALTYPGLHAVWWHRVAHALWRRNWRLLARLISNVSRWLTGIEIHPGARIGRRFFIDHGMGVVIGETAHIGDDCTLYHGVTLGGTTWREGKRHPTLGDGVVVGAGAKILGPVELGAGVRVGSNAVVLKDAPARATLVGIPARVVERRAEQSETKRRVAQRLGFDAYGVARDMPDPVATVVDRLLDHVQTVDDQLDEMAAAMRSLGVEVSRPARPSLDGCHLDEEDGVAGCDEPKRGAFERSETDNRAER